MTYPIFRLWAFPLIRIFIRNISGAENVPTTKNFIIVANHERLVDPVYLMYAITKKLNKKIHFLSSARWWFLGEAICRKWAGCVPLFDSEQAYRELKELVEAGEIVGIFPEGYLNAKKRNPKTGAVRLAIETKTPIMPIGLKSSYFPLSSGVNIGKLVYIKNKKNIEKQTMDIMKKIYKLRDSV